MQYMALIEVDCYIYRITLTQSPAYVIQFLTNDFFR